MRQASLLAFSSRQSGTIWVASQLLPLPDHLVKKKNTELGKMILNLIVKLFNKIVEIFSILIIIEIFSYLINTIEELKNVKETQLLDMSYNKVGTFYTFVYSNNLLMDNYPIIKIIFSELINNENFKKFGEYKIIICQAIIQGNETAFHFNTLINNNTTFEEYWSQIEDYVQNIYEDGYQITKIPFFRFKV